MKLLLLESRLLREDLLKFVSLSFGIPVLNFLLFAGNGVISSGSTTSQVLGLMFGSVRNFPMSWIYWIFLCFGYLLLLQIVWKPNVRMFEIYQVLRYQNMRLYWRIKFMAGFLLTVFYVFCSLAVTFAASLIMKAQPIWDAGWLTVFICLTLNLYIHALIWLALKVYALVEAAVIVVGLLFYAGVRVVAPYIPLYYAMKDHLQPYLLMTTFAIECLIIIMLTALIERRVKKQDLF
ncbi:hypothetical protein [Paenibacillus hamazuiensis]|uniref:hypothetical protein n=1 Tax=Paenibacillus hamazuiensis TaxID=2936508 RepID=UPI00200C4616|nr:hypothetical protein [Paenibacillus hamazuiensis]